MFYFLHFWNFHFFHLDVTETPSRKKRGSAHREEGGTTETYIAQMTVFDKNRWAVLVQLLLFLTDFWINLFLVSESIPTGGCSCWTESTRCQCKGWMRVQSARNGRRGKRSLMARWVTWVCLQISFFSAQLMSSSFNISAVALSTPADPHW